MNLHAQIVDGIKTLLHQQDYVVIPHFGGFVTQIHFSKLLVEKNLLTPPGKIISFNKQLRQNDGVLALWLKEELKISAEESLKHITEFSDYCSQVLRTKRRLNLENLGFFYLDLENNICFEPKNDSNYLLDSFGLSPVILNELTDVVVEKKEVEFVDRTVESVKQEFPVKRKRNLRPLAYVALGGAILFFSLAALVTINKSEGPLLSGIFNNNATKTYKPVAYSELVLEKTDSETKAYVANSEGIAVVDITSNKSIAVNVSENASSAEEVHVKKSHNSNYNNSNYAGKFQIVLGCFSVRNNAEKMVRKLQNKHVNAGISGINAKGMHVVSCAGFDTKDSALTFLQEVKANFPNAWIKSEN